MSRRLRQIPLPFWIIIAGLLTVTVTLGATRPDNVTLRLGGQPVEPIVVPAKQPFCSTFERLPPGTTAARYQLFRQSALPRSITLTSPSGTTTNLSFARRGRGLDLIAPIPVRSSASSTARPWKLCISAPRPSIGVAGAQAVPALDLIGAGERSWLAAVPTLIERAGFGRPALIGRGSLPLALLLLLAGLAFAVAALRSVRLPSPPTRRTITQVACLSLCFSSAFAITTPMFQSPDEPAHQHYAEYLADQHQLPGLQNTPGLAPQVTAIMEEQRWDLIAGKHNGRPPWAETDERQLQERLARTPSGPVPDQITAASPQPPGYYALAAVADTVTGGTTLSKTTVNRLLSALLCALGIAGAMVFARAAVPSAGPLITAAGIVAASFPLVAFIGGSVNPDAALIACSSWSVAGLAVSLRHGLTWRRGLWIGAATGLGMLSKLTFLGLVPGLLIGGIYLIARAMRQRKWRTAIVGGAAAAGPAAALGLPYYLWAQWISGRGLAYGGAPTNAPEPVLPFYNWLTYTIELYVGRFGMIDPRISGGGPHLFALGFAGRLGWLDYGPPDQVVSWLFTLWVALLVLAGVGVVRAFLRRRGTALAEMVIWTLCAGGVMLLLSRSGFYARATGQPGFEQARHLLALLPFGVAGAALALRQIPTQRLRLITATAFALIGLAHGVGLWLMTIGRYFA